MKTYHYLWIPFLTLICTQIIKFLFESCASKRFEWSRLFSGSGGMPSSHTAFTFSITACLGLGEGFDSPLFALSLIFSLVVAYDAMGLRKESGKHATMLNHMIDEIFSGHPDSGFQKLKEELGHNPAQVLVGAIFGSAMAYFFMWLF